MKRIAVLLFCLMILAGCGPGQAYVKATKKYHDKILPEYEKYIINREPVPEWSDSEKVVLQGTVDGIRRLDKQAKEKED